MKTIFLDLDGVMIVTSHPRASKSHPPHFEFSPIAVQCLTRLIEEQDAYIVLSSSLRLHQSLVSVKEHFLAPYGLSNRLMGLTPFRSSCFRSEEIQAYMDSKKGTRYEVSSFVILDDMSDMGHLQPYLVECDYHLGFTEKDYELATLVLTQQS